MSKLHKHKNEHSFFNLGVWIAVILGIVTLYQSYRVFCPDDYNKFSTYIARNLPSDN